MLYNWTTRPHWETLPKCYNNWEKTWSSTNKKLTKSTLKMKLIAKQKSINTTEELTSHLTKSPNQHKKSKPSAQRLNNWPKMLKTNKFNWTSWTIKKPKLENKELKMLPTSPNSKTKQKTSLKPLKSSSKSWAQSNQTKKSWLPWHNWTRLAPQTQSLPLCKLPQHSQLNNWTTSSTSWVKSANNWLKP